jgi:hypothetical protein
MPRICPPEIIALTSMHTSVNLNSVKTARAEVNSTGHAGDPIKEVLMRKIIITMLLVFIMAIPAMAKTDITLPPGFTQDDFKGLSRDLGLAISYMPLATAEPLGGTLPHFDLGVEGTSTSIDNNASYWTKISNVPGNSSVPSSLVMPKIHLQVGLPIIPIDLGVVYGEVPSTNIKYTGYEVKWAILKGSVATPAVALRGAYTKLSGVTDVDISTKSADLSISKGFAIFTPYAGYGMVWIDSKEKSSVVTLQDESLSESKWFLGCKLTFFPFMNLVAEADFAKVNSYSLRLNLHL